MIARRQRHQTGSVWLKLGSWYLRFYTNVGGERKQVARFLAFKDDKHQRGAGPSGGDDREDELPFAVRDGEGTNAEGILGMARTSHTPRSRSACRRGRATRICGSGTSSPRPDVQLSIVV